MSSRRLQGYCKVLAARLSLRNSPADNLPQNAAGIGRHDPNVRSRGTPTTAGRDSDPGSGVRQERRWSGFPREALSVPLMWVTGSPGVGKSTVCALLKSRGELAVDADWEGYNHWVDRTSGQVVTVPPYPVPAGWLERFAWK